MSAYVVFPSTNSGWITQEEYTSVCSIKLVRSCTLIIATISGLLSIVVRRGSQILAYSELLYPVTATSSGTRSPARNAAFTAPVAVMSSPQTMAVNFLFSAISFSTAIPSISGAACCSCCPYHCCFWRCAIKMCASPMSWWCPDFWPSSLPPISEAAKS